MPDEREYGGDADMEQDVTSIRRVALVFLAVVVACIALAVFLTHKSAPNRPQASVLTTNEDWHPYLKGTLDLPLPPAPVADEVPSPKDLPDTSDLRPSTDAPVVDAPVIEAPAIPAPVADETPAPMFQQSGSETTTAVETAPVPEPVVEVPVLPAATAADEAQHAHDYPLRRHRHYHRPHHRHQPQPQPRRHVWACPQYAIDYYDPFAALFHGLECLVEEMIH